MTQFSVLKAHFFFAFSILTFYFLSLFQSPIYFLACILTRLLRFLSFFDHFHFFPLFHHNSVTYFLLSLHLISLKTRWKIVRHSYRLHHVVTCLKHLKMWSIFKWIFRNTSVALNYSRLTDLRLGSFTDRGIVGYGRIHHSAHFVTFT